LFSISAIYTLATGRGTLARVREIARALSIVTETLRIGTVTVLLVALFLSFSSFYIGGRTIIKNKKKNTKIE